QEEPERSRHHHLQRTDQAGTQPVHLSLSPGDGAGSERRQAGGEEGTRSGFAQSTCQGRGTEDPRAAPESQLGWRFMRYSLLLLLAALPVTPATVFHQSSLL